MQIRLPAPHDRDFSFKKQIQFSGKRTFRAARAFGHRLDTTERLRAPRHNQAGVAEFSFTKKDGSCGFHSSFLARASEADNPVCLIQGGRSPDRTGGGLETAAP